MNQVKSLKQLSYGGLAAATAAPKKKSKLRNRDINTTTYT